MALSPREAMAFANCGSFVTSPGFVCRFSQERSFGALAPFLRLKPNEEQLNWTIAKSSFEELRGQEQEQLAKLDRLHPRFSEPTQLSFEYGDDEEEAAN